MPADRPGTAKRQALTDDLDGPFEADSTGKPARPDDPGPRRPPRPSRPERGGSAKSSRPAAPSGIPGSPDPSDDRPRRFGLRNTVVDRGSERASSGRVDRTVVAPSPMGPPNGVGRVDQTAESRRPQPRPEQPRSAKAPRSRTVDATPGPRRGRRVRRVVRRIDLWSVLKLSLVLYVCMYAAIMATLAALWGLAYSSGSIDKLQSFLGDVGLENFHFYGARMFKAVLAVGGVGVIAATVATVLATALVNVISEVTGGIRVVVIEEDVAPR